jgi:hypothetical protein
MVIPWRSPDFRLNGRGAGSCLVSLKISDTFQRPVRRFLSATSVPLPWFFRTAFMPPVFPKVSRTVKARQNHPVEPPCVPHRHARRPVRASRNDGSVRTRQNSPCRRRETIFREPGMGDLASAPHTPRRSRLAATPCSVSVTGRRHYRHRFWGGGKREAKIFWRSHAMSASLQDHHQFLP